MMAVITVPDEKRRIEEFAAINAFLTPFGIAYERWPLEDRVPPDAPAEQILAAYAPELDRLKAAGGYVTADVIEITPNTPNLDGLLNKFNKEHIHLEDEVRFCLQGSGLFHIHPDNGPVFSVLVEAGDLINVPKGTRHWFDLCSTRRIRAVRLFQDITGWTPHYHDEPVHAKYEPVCWGPTYAAPVMAVAPAVQP